MRQQKRTYSSILKESNSLSKNEKPLEQQPSKIKCSQPTESRLQWLSYILRHIFELEKLLKKCMANPSLFTNPKHISNSSRNMLTQLDGCKNVLSSEREKSIILNRLLCDLH